MGCTMREELLKVVQIAMGILKQEKGLDNVG